MTPGTSEPSETQAPPLPHGRGSFPAHGHEAASLRADSFDRWTLAVADLNLSTVPIPTGHCAKAITVINLKGGVGKTHTAWLIAGVCQEQGKKLLVVDTDTQANITRSFLPPGQSPTPGIEALFDSANDPDAETLIRTTRFPSIDLLPSSSALARRDLSDQDTWEQADLHFSLADGLRQVRNRYDYLVFDCPPRLSLVSFAALCASQYVIIPLEAADWGAQGIVQVTAAVNHVRDQYNPDLKLLGYLVSRFKRARIFQRSYLRKLRDHFGKLAFDTVIRDLAGYEKSVTHGIPITLHAPSSHEAQVARSFFREVERRIRIYGRCSPQGRRQHVQREAVTADR